MAAVQVLGSEAGAQTPPYEQTEEKGRRFRFAVNDDGGRPVRERPVASAGPRWIVARRGRQAGRRKVFQRDSLTPTGVGVVYSFRRTDLSPILRNGVFINGYAS